MAIPSNTNVIQKEAENELKYKNLSMEVQKMWNMKCVIPVTSRATGIVTKGLKICGHNTRKAVSGFSTEAAVLGTSRMTRRVPQPKWWGAPLVPEEKYQGKGNL